eukprot:CAMPEP_0171582134 /NCGR_PEP_ID=MMETSP0961-20121227/10015_1 /TAXON_ID=87120 /ORGANISM="Aurantiochytrium limacinum, Strain ATCCMYA-1381" /LENGTH=868 /DNA_ID=CAMNT_0012139069 /DNA_START=9 /DNA_END=2615 /DNA_ORIENTATION=+
MKRISVFGDSLVARGGGEEGGWCNRLASVFTGRADVVVRGFSGYNSRWLRAGLGNLLEQLPPVKSGVDSELAIIWIGANDAVLSTTGAKQFVPLDEYCENLKAMVQMIKDKERQVKILVLTPPPVDEGMRLEHQRKKYGDKATGQLERTNANTKNYARLCVETFAEVDNVIVVDLFSTLYTCANLTALLSDGLHFSPEGQKMVFTLVMKTVTKKLPQWVPAMIKMQLPSHMKMPTYPSTTTAEQVPPASPDISSSSPLAQLVSFFRGQDGQDANTPHADEKKGEELILRNGHFWQWETCAFTDLDHELVLRDGKISDLRPVPTLLQNAPDADETADKKEELKQQVHDLQGGYVLPGLVDAHIHVYQLGEKKRNLDLLGCKSISELKQRLAKFAAANPDRKWILGTGWDHEKMGGILPTRQDLDEVVPEGTKVVLWRVCLHILVANTGALEAAHISITNPKPVAGGQIDTDPTTGEATGVLRERATEAVVAHVKETNPAILAQSVTEGLNECLRHGLTGVETNDEATLEVYRKLDQEGKLPLRVQLTPLLGEIDGPWASSTGMLAVDRVKIFTDGALGSNTAALRNLDDSKQSESGHQDSTPSSTPDHRGILVHDPAELLRMVTEASKQNLRIEAHAIGDYAAQCTLKAFRSAGLGPKDRPVLTHCQILGPDLVEQMAQGGVIANIQPTFVPTDAAWVKERVHGEQLKYSYAWKTLINSGIQVSGSSDAPVECCAPLLGMYDAIYRPSSHDRENAEVFHDTETLTFVQALELYTLGANFAARQETTRGRIEPGFAADLTVVSENIAEDPKRLLTAQVTQVFVAGKARLHDGPGPSVASVIHQSGPYIEGKAGRFRDHLTCGCHHHHTHA